MIDWHIGCSGFHYKHWKGSFYPEGMAQRKWFEHYCQHFNTIELNVTFYRFPRLPALKNWYNLSPEAFQFAVKAPRAITHFKKFNEVAKMLSDFYNTTVQGLQEKLGCVLFQMPENFGYKEEHLDRIIKNLDKSLPNVLEFRHRSWWNEHVYTELSKQNISFCGMSHPALPNEIVNNTPLLYYRLHGEDQIYASSYHSERLMQIANAIQLASPHNAFIFFNNDIDTHAVYNATQMKKIAQELK